MTSQVTAITTWMARTMPDPFYITQPTWLSVLFLFFPLLQTWRTPTSTVTVRIIRAAIQKATIPNITPLLGPSSPSSSGVCPKVIHYIEHSRTYYIAMVSDYWPTHWASSGSHFSLMFISHNIPLYPGSHWHPEQFGARIPLLSQVKLQSIEEYK